MPVTSDAHLMPLRERSQTFGLAHNRLTGNRLRAEPFGHAKEIIDLVVRNRSGAISEASFGWSNLEKADSARSCRFRNSPRKRASLHCRGQRLPADFVHLAVMTVVSKNLDMISESIVAENTESGRSSMLKCRFGSRPETAERDWKRPGRKECRTRCVSPEERVL
jgi:hypothetical protein